jgi:hypothetical protein
MSKKTNGHSNGHGHLPTYKSYVFKTKDPVIDELRTIAEQHYGRRINGKTLAEIAEDGGPSSGCMRGWFFGATKRPQNPTVEAAGRAMGFQRVWRRMRANAKED